jgi:hypothetical protein
MNLLSSHLILESCGLCLLDETSSFEKVRELSVREFSTPIRSKHKNDKLFTENQSDAAYASGLIDDRPASFLGSKMYRLIYNLLTQPSTQQQLFRFQDDQFIDQDEHDRGRSSLNSNQVLTFLNVCL